MLGKLLVRYLKTYRWWLLGVLVFQFASAMASLFLPRLNADIIDNGVTRGDVGYIWSHGVLMLGVALGQIVASVIATFFAARAAMSAGRDIRRDVFEKVGGFSEREVSRFGAGTLITRNTNDVQQVQMLAMMGATMLVTAPLLAIGGIIMALRQDVGLSWLIGVSVPNLSGGYSTMMPNHHITKPVLIGEIQDDGQFDVVWETPGLVVGDEWSDFLPDSKDLISDWRAPMSCGNFNVATGKCGGKGE